jgi:dephospho-CoA kinase
MLGSNLPWTLGGETVGCRKVAVTGILGSGKSQVLRLFGQLGAATINSDQIVHRLLATDEAVKERVAQLIPEAATENGISREMIADRIFASSQLRSQLEAILHPVVMREIEERYEQVRETAPLFVAEVPLLIKAGLTGHFGPVVVVDAPTELCMARYCAAGGTAAEYQRRAATQLSGAEMRAGATHIIQNEGTLEALETQVKRLYQELSRQT